MESTGFRNGLAGGYHPVVGQDLGQEEERIEALEEESSMAPAEGSSPPQMPDLPQIPVVVPSPVPLPLPPFPDLTGRARASSSPADPADLRAATPQKALFRRSAFLQAQPSSPFLQPLAEKSGKHGITYDKEELLRDFVEKLEASDTTPSESPQTITRVLQRQATELFSFTSPRTPSTILATLSTLLPGAALFSKTNPSHLSDLVQLRDKVVKKDAEALFIVGQCFKEGLIVDSDLRKYFFLTLESANLGFIAAQAEMSRIYREGMRGIFGSQLTEAISYAEAAAKGNDAECCDYLSQICFAKRDYLNALKYAEIAAFKGILTSILLAKRIYVEGHVGSKSEQEQKVLLFRQLGAERRDSHSLFEMHRYHKDRAEYDLAVGFAEEAASLDHPGANDYMGHYYYGHRKRPDLAIPYFRKASDQGNVSSHEYLGLCLEKGDGVAKNPVESANHYKYAADHSEEKGCKLSKYKIGIFFRDGIGVDKSNAQARQYLEKAVAAGHSEAKQALEGLPLKTE